MVADTIAALPARLRTKLDAAVAQAATWLIDGHEVRLPGDTVVTLTPADGVLRDPEQVRCGCLLAPACLHRAAVLAAAPVAEQATRGQTTMPAPTTQGPKAPQITPDAHEPVRAHDDTAPDDTGEHGSDAWRASEQRAATAVATAAGWLLDAGLPGAGAAVQADLLRALHHARIQGLHRLAAAATRVVTAVRAGRDDDPSFRLHDLCGDLLEVLETAHVIRTGRGDPAAWRGQARTQYAAVGGLRLTGLCLEPVISDAGYAGVVVWLVDLDGRFWSVSDVRPGNADRVRSSAQGPVAVGETGLSHSQLSRAGMVLAGATANLEGRLGAGKNVRAVSARGTPWSDPPLRSLFAAANPGPLALLELTICGSTHTRCSPSIKQATPSA